MHMCWTLGFFSFLSLLFVKIFPIELLGSPDGCVLEMTGRGNSSGFIGVSGGRGVGQRGEGTEIPSEQRQVKRRGSGVGNARYLSLLGFR